MSSPGGMLGGSMQSPHVPTLCMAIGAFVVLLLAYHLVHKH